MATATRSRVSARYDRIKRADTIIEPFLKQGKHLRDVALYIQNLYPFSEACASSTSLTLPPVHEVKESMKILLPSPQDILTEELLCAPLFPLALLRDVAALYGFDDVPEGWKTALELSANDMSNSSIMTHVWFTYFLGCSHDTIRSAMDTYRRI